MSLEAVYSAPTVAGGDWTPPSDDGAALGTTDLKWSDVFLALGGVVNFNNGDVTLTHAAGKLTLGGDGSVEFDFNNHEMTNVDINSGTIDGISSLTSSGDLDIGAHDFRAATLTADGLTSGRVVIATTNGRLTDDADLLFSGSTLSVGLAGASTGIFNLSGVTSGVVSITVAAAAGTYTLTLPTDNGGVSEFLQTNGSGVLTWAVSAGTYVDADAIAAVEGEATLALSGTLSVPEGKSILLGEEATSYQGATLGLRVATNVDSRRVAVFAHYQADDTMGFILALAKSQSDTQGTLAYPGADSILGQFVFAGADEDGSRFEPGAEIRGVATELWTATASGSKLEFYTTDNATLINDLRLTIDQDGSLTATNGGSLTGTWSDLGTVTTVIISGGTITAGTIDATTDFTIGTLVITDDTLTFGGAGSITGLSTMSMTSVGDMTFNPTGGFDITLTDDESGSIDFANSAVTYYRIDTRNTAAAVEAHVFNTEAPTIASVAGTHYHLVALQSFTWTLTGGTNITTPIDGFSLRILQPVIDSADATTITQLSTLYVPSADVSDAEITVTRNLAAEIDGPLLLTNSIFAEATPTEGTSGEQLESAGAGAVVIWATAGSRREYKDIGSEFTDTAEALAALVATPVYNFKYPQPVYVDVPEVHSEADARGELVDTTVMVPRLVGERKLSTGDYDTDYVGVMAEDAPWAMHHGGRMLNPINTFGYTTLAIKELDKRLTAIGA
ncbi:hypothetical protein LCGC14_1273720 [marine sediment metagenome]|uniref:Peptidase S74 domain-containing protein n=1 Tax=marine sediment metagenome TaxID=412755 RepID=A0A0F9KZ41_9ZZZZ